MTDSFELDSQLAVHPGMASTLSAYFCSGISEFCSMSLDSVLGALARNSAFAVDPEQRDAWVREIELLQRALNGISGDVLLEFVVPRIGTRLDCVVVSSGIVFVLEFKVGEATFHRSAINQVWDYGLDLKNFHKASHQAPIVPILVATEATDPEPRSFPVDADGVYRPILVGGGHLGSLIRNLLSHSTGKQLSAVSWAAAPYQPTPTIIEAAQALYSQHSVAAISRHDAGARNLTITSRRVEECIEEARQFGRKILVLITGVPGAGKTLVGLNVATKRRDEHSPSHAVFLSGNGPLVDVLREALVKDELSRSHRNGKKLRRGAVEQKVKAFIQNVHHFRDQGLRDSMNPPADHVVIFDEAQRAWDHRKTESFMLRKKKIANFQQSEPEFLLSYMDRHRDWAVVVCLVGGGQEINDGEAGISAWLEAAQSQFPHWKICVSSNLTDSEYVAQTAIDNLAVQGNLERDERLHLNVSMRSFRAENVSNMVKAILDRDSEEAARLVKQVSARYPIALSRDLDHAKQWLRKYARGTQRFGMVASSGAMRLKPHAIDVRYAIKPTEWFLKGAEDTRSSWYLEDVATEFHVQGLELDWVLMSWDADLVYSHLGWEYRDFRGSKWTQIRKPENKRYLLNAYRVLLTRARQGMVIFIPEGDLLDPTRSSPLYDPTFGYLKSLGIPVLGAQ